MQKRILLLASVAALMAVMLVAMASAALAVPDGPPKGDQGCVGGQTNAAHAVDGPTGSPSWGAQDNVEQPSQAYRAPGTQNNPGIEDHASNNTNDTSNCDRD